MLKFSKRITQKNTAYKILAVFALTVMSPVSAWACSSCGCTLSPEWISEGYSSKPGLKLDLRYDFLNQNQLRSGTHAVSEAIPNADEIQKVTRTHIYNVALDYSPNRDWGVNVEIPFLDRYHTTFAPGDVAETASDTKDIGDVKILARYQGFTDDKTVGVQFGLKLPTGSFHQTFSSGPAAGDALDRGLQAGTGTTDLLLGVYNVGALGKNFDRFEQILVKTSLNTREDFRPGTAVNGNVGIRYLALPKLIPQFQINAKIEERDSGAQADIPNSGSTVVYASPGITYPLSKNVNTYGFVQVPLYQDYNGLALAARYTASIGLRYAF